MKCWNDIDLTGHVDFRFWKQHKHHHVFYNPSPFSVIADEWVDQVTNSFKPRLIFLSINIANQFILSYRITSVT